MSTLPGPRGPHDREDDEVAALLRATLTREADMVRPSEDGYDRISDRVHAHDRRGRTPRWLPWAAGLAAAAVVALVVGLVVLDPGGEADPVATPTGSAPSPAPTSSDAPTTSSPSTTAAPTGEVGGVAVYWVGDTRTQAWLYREFQTVADQGDPVLTAVRALLSGAPLDPDYRSAWTPPSRLDVTRDGDAITVDVSADALENTQVGSQEAVLAVQQVVWTATAAAQSPGPVTILVDGEPADAWGAVALGEPMTRQADLQAQIWIDSPNNGDEVGGTVTVSGVGTAFEANLNYDVTDASGTVVADGFTMAGANGEFAGYEFSVDLTPGTYTVAVFAEDVSDGESPEGPRMHEQTRTFTVG